jgi:hypothetical protein
MSRRIVYRVIALIVVAISVYSTRLQIQTFVWHREHGDKIEVGKYQIPVPKAWLGTDSMELLNIKSKAVIQMYIPLNKVSSLHGWANAVQDSNLKRGTQGSAIKEVRSDSGESFICIETTSSVECRAAGQLHVLFLGSRNDMGEFYSILRGIRPID